MNNVVRMLNKAKAVSIQRDDDRHFRVGSIAIRGDGVMVQSYNGAPKFPDRLHHSEGRICRKLDRGAIVFVARTTKDGQWANSSPCFFCRQAMRRAHVKRVYYTLGPNEYGLLIF